ncbi:carbohydrate sulfotransferase 11-like [Patiria miniata]|uniref:Carbohydrate sulfotransferase n=1 Tax=Patiria miniata TaxID=46514 RepID=A0A914AZP0_PATMI|nr:carbohydrate sulfotransferase 11-like [Patiria miniata]
MATLSSTRNMFNFVLVLYLLGFITMVTRWRKVEFEDDSITQRDHDGDHFKSSTLQHSLVDVKESSEAVKQNNVLKIERKMPILNKDISLESEEILDKQREPVENRSLKEKRLKQKPAFKKGKRSVNETPPHSVAKASIKGNASTNQTATKRRTEKIPVVGKEKKLTTRSKQAKKKTTLNNNADKKTLWQTEQTRRRNTLHQVCSRYDNYGQQRDVSEIIKKHKRSFWPFIVEDKYRLLYTFVSKVGSTNWKSAFLVLKGKYKSVEDVPGRFAHSPSLIKLSTLPEEGIKRRLDNYTNFIFVRHPFARVLSAYRSKFLQPNLAFQKSTGVRIIKMYRQNATKESLATGKDVSFPEFIRYIVNAKTINFDGHWQPIYKMVLPCAVRFDYIGKLETGEEDAKYILKETKVDHLVHFMTTKRNVSHDAAIFNHYYSQIPNKDLVKLYKVYQPDFQLFGYEVPDTMKTLLKVSR